MCIVIYHKKERWKECKSYEEKSNICEDFMNRKNMSNFQNDRFS